MQIQWTWSCLMSSPHIIPNVGRQNQLAKGVMDLLCKDEGKLHQNVVGLWTKGGVFVNPFRGNSTARLRKGRTFIVQTK